MTFPTDVDGTWVNPATVSLDAGELRRADSAAFAGAGAPFDVLGGIVRHAASALSVTVDGSDVVTVQPGAVVIPGNAVSGTGPYRSALVTAATGSLTARNATNPRIDLVVFRQLDTDVVGTHGAYKGRVDIIAGTPAATPGVPALPSMGVELGRITVPNTGGGAASVDSSYRTYACALGAELWVPTFARLAGYTVPTGSYQRARALDTGVRYEWSGSTWVAQKRIQSGQVTVTPTAADTQTTQTVTFPQAFTAAPEVAVAINTGTSDGANAYSLAVWSSGATATNFVMNLRRGNTTPTVITWIASGT